MALAVVVVVPLCNKFSKRVVVFIGMVIGVAGGLIAGLGNGSIVPVAAGVALKCLGGFSGGLCDSGNAGRCDRPY